jgi:hypothetical protein
MLCASRHSLTTMLCISLGGESVSVPYDVISGRKRDAVSFIRYSGLGRLIDYSPPPQWAHGARVLHHHLRTRRRGLVFPSQMKRMCNCLCDVAIIDLIRNRRADECAASATHNAPVRPQSQNHGEEVEGMVNSVQRAASIWFLIRGLRYDAVALLVWVI